MIRGAQITSLQSYINHIKYHRLQWGREATAWFRGEPDVSTPLLPKVFRPKVNGTYHNENTLLQMFRMKAGTFSTTPVPARENTDQWLFLAQHVGLPTRLLDWTESALVGLYFALEHKKPIVWMLEPKLLNNESITVLTSPDFKFEKSFPLTWVDPPGIRNIGVENIKGAWQQNYDGIELPVAVVPTNVHPRMSAQRSVFTIHGSRREPLNEVAPARILRRYTIPSNSAESILNDLHLLGIHASTAFPDLDGLARELADLH